MTPFDIYRQAKRFGLRLDANKDTISIRPADRCPPEFVNLLKEHKGALLEWLNRCPRWLAVPPYNLPLSPITPKPTPTGRELVINFMVRQGCDQPSPLTAWLVRRENTYYDGPGASWDCNLFAYAAARDAACWQLSRNEPDMIQMIQSFHGEPLG